MSWKFVRSSVVGAYHQGANLACQDYCHANLVGAGDGQDYLLCLVADGAGSAREGGTGAEIACRTARTCIENLLNQPDCPRHESVVADWIEDVRQAIAAAAVENGLEVRDYACTLLGAVVNRTQGLFFQIGDGAIVVFSDPALGVVFWPEAGPYANMTDFVTDDDALDHLRVTMTHSTINELALFSDGLQRLALDFSQRTPHAPFFEPMLQTLRVTAPDQCQALNEHLTLFLGSPPVNTRTDDDKTLILATRRAP